MRAWDPRPLRSYYNWLGGEQPPNSDLSWFAPYIPVLSTALCEAILEAEGRPARDLPALRKLLSEPTVFEVGE